MVYKVIIMPPAKRRLDMYVFYTVIGQQTGGKSNPCGCKRYYNHELQDYEGLLTDELHLQ
ncbi:MAG: hypothetical protein K2O59_12995 [Lachnospiraceae bacterium]|nr:hypothetical protein [Lachnospiraceae bacterium]